MRQRKSCAAYTGEGCLKPTTRLMVGIALTFCHESVELGPGLLLGFGIVGTGDELDLLLAELDVEGLSRNSRLASRTSGSRSASPCRATSAH